MGTDRDIVLDCPCKCGKGSFQVDYCSPDHGWPTSTPFWYEMFINCTACAKTFDLQQQGNYIVVVEKSEIKKREMLKKEAYSRGAKLLKTPKVKDLLKRFEALLNEQKSVAAIHRILSAANLDYYSLGSFRKNWRGSEYWIEHHISHFNLPEVMKLLKSTDRQILDEVKKIKELSKQSEIPPPPVGEPIYKIRA